MAFQKLKERQISKMEFEFERRRVTKEDIRELIYREILEYHPQLLKEYMNGDEGTNFLYPSAIGQFRSQFAYLEENGGRNGPVIPLERKHVSLPRSSFHSSTITSIPWQTVNSMENRQTAGEVCRSLATSDVVSGNPTKVLRPPPRVLAREFGTTSVQAILMENHQHTPHVIEIHGDVATLSCNFITREL